MEGRLRLVDEQPGLAVARFRSLVVFAFARDATVRDLRLVARHQDSVLCDRGRCTAISVLARFPTLRVDEEVREASIELARRFDGRLVGVGFVSRETGLRARVMRRILPGLFVVARSETPHGVFFNVGETARWIGALDGQEPALEESPDQLAAELRGFGDRAIRSFESSETPS